MDNADAGEMGQTQKSKEDQNPQHSWYKFSLTALIPET